MIKVILADDHTLVREGIASLLGDEEDISIIGQAGNGREALAMAKQLEPDVAVLDVAMPELNGMDATELLRKACPRIRVVALSMHADGHYVRKVVDAGALAYVLKNGAFHELARAIRAAHRGRRYFSAGLGYVAPGGDKQVPPPLTTREREVVQLIAEGRRTSEVAENLHISVKTVETHRKRIMDKLGLDNIAGLVKYAIKEGIITLEQ